MAETSENNVTELPSTPHPHEPMATSTGEHNAQFRANLDAVRKDPLEQIAMRRRRAAEERDDAIEGKQRCIAAAQTCQQELEKRFHATDQGLSSRIAALEAEQRKERQAHQESVEALQSELDEKVEAYNTIIEANDQFLASFAPVIPNGPSRGDEDSRALVSPASAVETPSDDADS